MPPDPRPEAGQGRAARQLGGAGAAPGGCSGPAPGLGQRCPGLRRGRGVPGPGTARAPRPPRSSGRSHTEPAPMGGWDRSHPARTALPGPAALPGGGQPRPSSPLFHSCCGFSRTASAPCCQPGALELQSPAATEVASELHAKPFPHYLFISFPPARAVPPSWPEWKSTFKSRTRLSHVVSCQAAVTVTPRSHRAPELPLCPARKAQGDEHF